MRIFVISWFFPPSNSSEGVVTFKLLKGSKHSYLVCHAISDNWGYSKPSISNFPSNIHTRWIKTNSIKEWEDFCYKVFIEENAREPFNAIMTRTMPPESIQVALSIREKFPLIPWVASFGDPISKSPYNLDEIKNCSWLEEKTKHEIIASLGLNKITSDIDFPSKAYFVKMKDLEQLALSYSQLLLCPHQVMAKYMFGEVLPKHVKILPHSFDSKLFPRTPTEESDDTNKKIVLSYFGTIDSHRNLNIFLDALFELKEECPDLTNKLSVLIYGKGLDALKNKVFNTFLYDIVEIKSEVSYSESLLLMQHSDWLLHVDAFFTDLATSGGSIYFAGKIADYLGTKQKIFALTGHGSPSAEITKKAGGVVAEPFNKKEILENLKEIVLSGTTAATINPIEENFRTKFESSKVAHELDRLLGDLKNNQEIKLSCNEPILSICVPAYNASKYLDRLLTTLTTGSFADLLEVIVVDDGSKDRTKEIAEIWVNKYPQIVKLISKENGGHGSTINAAIKVATGKYFRVVDADDWVDSANLAKFLDKLKNHEFLGCCYPDLILSNYSRIALNDSTEEEVNKINPLIPYNTVLELASTDISSEYFSLASITYKTAILKSHISEVRLQEKTYYVDVEYMLYPLPFIKTLLFVPESIYRYSVGRLDQSTNATSFIKHFSDHDRVMRRMISWFSCRQKNFSSPLLTYFKRILFLHLVTHASLCLSSNPSKRKSFQEFVSFDQFVKNTQNQLVQEQWNKLSEVRLLRSTHNFELFQLKLYSNTRAQKIKNNSTKLKNQAKNKLKEVLKKTVFYKPLKKIKHVYDRLHV